MSTAPEESYSPCNGVINFMNPPFWVASHLWDPNTYVVYRETDGGTYKEIKVRINGFELLSSHKLTREEQIYLRQTYVK